MTEKKVREDRLRRKAERRGLKLVKSRTRDPDALDYGSYMLLEGNTVVFGATRRAFGDNFTRDMAATLDHIEEYLSR